MPAASSSSEESPVIADSRPVAHRSLAARSRLVALLAIAFIAGTGWLVADRLLRLWPPSEMAAVPVIDTSALLALVDHTGRPLGPAAVDKPALVVFFGYTHCPDICPMELATMAASLEQLGAAAEQVGAFFVSVDPERDTAERLADFVPYFDPRITGLTGSPEAIAAAAGAFRAFYAKVEADDGSYTVDHFARTLVLDRAGHLVAAVPFDSPVEALTNALRPLLEHAP
jgi:protein SCO1/2